MKQFILVLGVAAATFAFSGTASAKHPWSYGGYRGGNAARVYHDHGSYHNSYRQGNAWRHQNNWSYSPYRSYAYRNYGYAPYYGSYGYQPGLTFGVNRPGFSFGINIRR